MLREAGVPLDPCPLAPTARRQRHAPGSWTTRTCGPTYPAAVTKALRRPVKTGAVSPQGVRIEQGLIGGEDVIVNPPPALKNGDKVRQKS